MIAIKKIIAASMLSLMAAGGGQAMAADSTDADVRRLKDDARAVGRDYADMGREIADNAVDFAEDVADNFMDAYDDAKRDAKGRLDK